MSIAKLALLFLMVAAATVRGEVLLVDSRSAPVSIFVLISGDGVGNVLSDPAGIHSPGACVHGFEPGTPLVVTATPQNGYAFTRWTGGPCIGSSDPVCAFVVQQSLSLGVEFMTEQNLGVLFDGIGAGRVTSEPIGVDCTGNCFVRFATGTTVTLTATAAPGSVFAGWTTVPQPGDCFGTQPTCTLAMTGARIARPRFDPLPPVLHRLDVFLAGAGQGSVAGSPGAIACPGICSAEYSEDTVVQLQATAQAGSSFSHWSGACGGTSPACEIVMSAGRSAFAHFTSTPVQHALDVTVTGAGSGRILSSPAGIDCPGDCANSYPQGQQVTLAPHANPGSVFNGWAGNPCAAVGAEACTLVMNQAYTVAALFGSDSDRIFEHGFEAEP